MTTPHIDSLTHVCKEHGRVPAHVMMMTDAGPFYFLACPVCAGRLIDGTAPDNVPAIPITKAEYLALCEATSRDD